MFLHYLMFQVYNDRQPMQRHYEAMKKWVDFRTSTAKRFLERKLEFWRLGFSTAANVQQCTGPTYHAHAANLLAQTEEALGM